MTTQNVIEKFDEEFETKLGSKKTIDDIKQFLKDSLTEMLEGIELKLPQEEKLIFTGNIMADTLENDEKRGHNSCRQEVINIINSLK